jgi:xanthine phosphoribosyltransferase
MDTINLSWLEIEDGCYHIADYFLNKNISTVVGIARGGIIPASIIARKLKADFIAINAKSYNEQNVRETLQIQSISSIEKLDNVLFVDDICDSGHTLKKIREMYSNILNLYTAAIVYKQNDNIIPDCYYMPVFNDNWIVFPWEKD